MPGAYILTLYIGGSIKLKTLIKLKNLYMAYMYIIMRALVNDLVWHMGCISKDDSRILVL